MCMSDNSEICYLHPPSLQEAFAGVVRRVEGLRGRMAETERQACPERSRRVEGLFEGLLSEAFAYNAPTFLPHRPCREQRHGGARRQMPTCKEFGGGEYDVGMNILIYTQLDIVSPPFSSRSSLRGANGGAWRGQNATLSKK
jgi:hypothetical protein